MDEWEQQILPFEPPPYMSREDMRAVAAEAGMHAVAGSFSFNRLVYYARYEAPEFLIDSPNHDERAVNIRVVEHMRERPRYILEGIYHLSRRSLSLKVARLAYEQFVHSQAPSNEP